MSFKARLILGLFVFAGWCAALRAQTVALPYQVVVNPIFVQNGVGGNVAVQTNYGSSFSLFQEATQRIFAQAGVRLVWQAPSVYTNSTYYTVSNDTDVGNLVQSPSNGGIFDNKTLNVWFTGSNGGTLGVSQQSNNVTSFIFPTIVTYYGATVSEAIFNPSGNYSLTTLAHEMGHVLGLFHTAVGAGPVYTNTALSPSGGNIMAGGTVGATAFSQISTGLNTGIGFFTPEQVAMLRLNPLVTANPVAGDTYSYSAVPEPTTGALIGGLCAGLLALGYRRWTKRKTG